MFWKRKEEVEEAKKALEEVYKALKDINLKAKEWSVPSVSSKSTVELGSLLMEVHLAGVVLDSKIHSFRRMIAELRDKISSNEQGKEQVIRRIGDVKTYLRSAILTKEHLEQNLKSIKETIRDLGIMNEAMKENPEPEKEELISKEVIVEHFTSIEGKSGVSRSGDLSHVRTMCERGVAPTRAGKVIPVRGRLSRSGDLSHVPTGGGFVVGLDLGTTNIVGASQNDPDSISTKIERAAFVPIKWDKTVERVLKSLNMPYVVYDNKRYILGKHAFELANISDMEIHTPLKCGLLNPEEESALPLVKHLIGNVIDTPKLKGEVCCFSVPGESVDSELDTIYHKEELAWILKGMGFTPKPIIEGYTVVLSELAEQDYTGIGISCGGGMSNICVAYKSVPTLSFSISRGGDWIDTHVAQALGIRKSKAMALKEEGVNLIRPGDREQEAIVVYYRSFIVYLLRKMKHKFESLGERPSFPEPIDIVCTGGTTLANGFIEMFREEFRKIEFPIKVMRIRRAEEPLYTNVQGCLFAGLLESGKNG